ncbi:hypothetical protein OS493_007498 [Desmophyllum pertusum]|uniref:CCHC-type domain-containing protein n=1 Tax=Desmophyllum pertusum TaxID=174260 RepID=A0A9W9Z3R5_9CNID|nr:hypothetical protein OS493_007498 [Desmophyllum pertusum]
MSSKASLLAKQHPGMLTLTIMPTSKSVLAKLDALIDGITDKPAEEQQSQVLLTKLMFDELLEKATRRIGDVPPREGNTASIAAFFEANKGEAPELLKEIRRMENTFTDKLESLYRRVDNRMNTLAKRNQTYRTEQADNREYNRRAKPVCYRCGRIGHIQYNCSSYYQPEDQHQNYEERHEYRTNYNPPQREFVDQRLEH